MLRRKRRQIQAPPPIAEASESERAILLNDEQLREYAQALAQRHRVDTSVRGERLRPLVDAAEQALSEAFQTVRAATSNKQRVEPAAEWLLDNFVLIGEQARIVREGLPDSYSRQLPIIKGGRHDGMPRILAIVRELIAHVDGRADDRVMRDFVRAYQTHVALTLGELWAMPVMLRLALIERMAGVAASILVRLQDYAAATHWAQQMLDVATSKPNDLILRVADMARSAPPDSRAFAAEFYRLLQGKHPSLALPLAWIEQRFAQQQWSMPQLLEVEGRIQATDQVSISNCVNSLRIIARISWARVVESVSLVEATLRKDPAQVYARMDFHTRDRYRHVVEDIARRGSLVEHEVADRAVQCAADAAGAQAASSQRRSHVGYYLVDAGRPSLEHALGVQPDMRQRLRRASRAHPLLAYAGSITLLTLGITALVVWPSVKVLPWAVEMLCVLGLLVAASYPAVALVNLLFSRMLRPVLLPRMDFEKGIPDACRTLVVVPCMLVDDAGIRSEIEQLEMRYLGNRDANLCFALLTDYTDADSASMPEDAHLLALARAGIERLNTVHAAKGPCRFYLFHRARQWSRKQRVWMGLERKRGKLAQLNLLLRGASGDVFTSTVGDLQRVRKAVYVITLDADTELPPHAAARLVETMAHPLNQPRFDRTRRRVVEGYGILQPRISVAAEAGNASLFARLFSDDTGLDPYTRAISNVYQDLFGEASYVGKGIYHVDAFTRAVGTRFPDDLILSHDLLEGSYARTGLVSDIELREHHPDRYSTEARRRHRWTRGDWQILDWLLPVVPGPRGRYLRNALKAEHRWKILDNLRRGLVPIAFMTLWLRGWVASPQSLYWTLVLLGFLLVTPLLASVLDLFTKPQAITWRVHGRDALESSVRRLMQGGLLLAVMPYEAVLNLDAIARSAFRMLLTRRRLLEWTPASAVATATARHLDEFVRMMWVAPAGVIATLVALLLRAPGNLWPALPLLVLWLLAPLIAWASSRPRSPGRDVRLSASQRALLGVVARRTWRYFDRFVTAEHHWLPPDNYQEYPNENVAARTSPTNIGLSLLANLSAGDFAYITPSQVLERCERTLSSMQQLRRHQGHLLNWYDTTTLQVLRPAYVSSVDSGNLLGCLSTLRCGLLALSEQALIAPTMPAGLADTLRVLHACLVRKDIERRSEVLPARRAIDAVLTTLAAAQKAPSSLRNWRALLQDCAALGDSLTRDWHDRSPPRQAAEWLRAYVEQCAQWAQAFEVRAPWLALDDAEMAQPASIQTAPIQAALAELDRNPSLLRARELAAQICAEWEHDPSAIDREPSAVSREPSTAALHAAMQQLVEHADEQEKRCVLLARQCAELAEVDFECVWDGDQQLLAIGYNIDEGTRDAAHYDLLASEARLTSFIGIARHQLPQTHWFALGRLLTSAAGRTTLLSWSGSMFEYLMPLLMMPSFENTLLDRACRAAIDNQIAYGRQLDIPWGISECAYNTTDAHLTYQYRAFGVPGLGLKRGLSDDVVIAPYATAMALMLRPDAAVRNLQRLADMDALADFGFYEALDFTEARVSPGQRHALVRTFMAHHQGMSLLGISALLHDEPMQRRFLREPAFRANQLLLRERVPSAEPVGFSELHAERPDAPPREVAPPARIITKFNTSVPQVQLLSNGRYHVMISQAGGGYSRWNDLALTPWGQDGTRDADGSFCYLRDLDSGRFWSTTLQPTGVRTPGYVAVFSQARAEFSRSDEGIEARTQISISTEDDIELRRVRLSNRSGRKRRIEITSYLEVGLAHPGAIAAHPAFNKLFVETEILRPQLALLAQRRARADDEHHPYMVHLMAVRGSAWSAPSFETSRERFIGRGGSLARPDAMVRDGDLSGSQGPVLDPVLAVRRSISLEPGKSATVDLVTGIAPTREAATRLIAQHVDRHLDTRVFELAWTRAQVNRQQLDISEKQANLYARLAGSVLYSDPQLRPQRAHAYTGQSALWKYGISGDLPIVLLRIADLDHFSLVRQLVQAHTYWTLHGMQVDLVIWNENASGYRQELHDAIMGLISSGAEAMSLDRSGGIFVRPIEQVSAEDRALMLAVARAAFSGGGGTLSEQLRKQGALAPTRPRLRLKRRRHRAGKYVLQPPRNLQFFNGHGGFSGDGREYVIWLPPGTRTPAPWVNVLANPQFGSVVSESGSAYTWSRNAHDFRLTPWHNDPVCDPTGEAFYLRDESSGQVWSPTPLPAPAPSPYQVTHGFGYSRFESRESDIHCELTTFVPPEQPLKYVLIQLRNDSDTNRRLSVTGYVEWVLGELRMHAAPHVSTRLDGASSAIFAGNFFDDRFSRTRAFFACSDPAQSWTADRREFIGRNGSLAAPAAMRREQLSGISGAGHDPCAAIHVTLELAPGESHELVFALGSGASETEARRLASTAGSVTAAIRALESVHAYWDDLLGGLKVRTPDPQTDLLVNGWLVYQIVSARLWGRSGYYQSGGAYGFRDQLQDAMALAQIEPKFAREQLLRCAAHQFVQGDVQHWWHPPGLRGVRTTMSDDYLWLPWAAADYVAITGDHAILDEQIAFIEGRQLNAEEESYYDFADPSAQAASLYEHCRRAIEHGLRFGQHGLPLIGGGDWNDGMNRVGRQGRGESVWLGFFLYDVIQRFLPLAREREDTEFIEHLTEEAATLVHNIEAHAWDGAWYLRAFTDNGEALGSNRNEECRIDSIAQSWATISRAADPQRAEQALRSTQQHLVQEDARLVQLFDPPFDRSAVDPGYIKGYVPGVRENGGQYTHAAIWLNIALARRGHCEDAWRIYRMLQPINHALDARDTGIYRVEPYVMAADIYATDIHRGRGGWTWYTGAAGWMYRLAVESLLGLQRVEDRLNFSPCVPDDWQTFSIDYRCAETVYHIAFERGGPGNAVQSLTLDGSAHDGTSMPLNQDGGEHTVLVKLGESIRAAAAE